MILCVSNVYPQTSFVDKQLIYSEVMPTNDHFYIIKEGTAVVQDIATGAVLEKLGVGDHCGDKALTKNTISYNNAQKGVQVGEQGVQV